MKMIVKMTLFFGVVLLNYVHADQLAVCVRCSNGQSLANLRIQVQDQTGLAIPGVTQTDGQGVFVIENSETFITPFLMFFEDKNGSTCGPYMVAQGIGFDMGQVFLNYYPTDVPCSCAGL